MSKLIPEHSHYCSKEEKRGVDDDAVSHWDDSIAKHGVRCGNNECY